MAKELDRPPGDEDGATRLPVRRTPDEPLHAEIMQEGVTIRLREAPTPSPPKGLGKLVNLVADIANKLCMLGRDYAVAYLEERAVKNANVRAQTDLFKEQALALQNVRDLYGSTAPDRRKQQEALHAIGEAATHLANEATSDPQSAQKRQAAENAIQLARTAQELAAERADKDIEAHLKALRDALYNVTVRKDDAPR